MVHSQSTLTRPFTIAEYGYMVSTRNDGILLNRAHMNILMFERGHKSSLA